MTTTPHAQCRIKTRIRDNGFEVMKSKEFGVPMSATTGKLRRYLDHLRHRSPKYKHTQYYVYGKFVYVMRGDVVKTVLDIPEYCFE